MVFVRCLCGVCVLCAVFVLCLCGVCAVFVWCLCSVCVVFVRCLCCVCVMYVRCLCGVLTCKRLGCVHHRSLPTRKSKNRNIGRIKY